MKVLFLFLSLFIIGCSSTSKPITHQESSKKEVVDTQAPTHIVTNNKAMLKKFSSYGSDDEEYTKRIRINAEHFGAQYITIPDLVPDHPLSIALDFYRIKALKLKDYALNWDAETDEVAPFNYFAFEESIEFLPFLFSVVVTDDFMNHTTGKTQYSVKSFNYSPQKNKIIQLNEFFTGPGHLKAIDTELKKSPYAFGELTPEKIEKINLDNYIKNAWTIRLDQSTNKLQYLMIMPNSTLSNESGGGYIPIAVDLEKLEEFINPEYKALF